ncbi:MAG: hypothetical protein AAB434_01535, partial [Planctomycetota bacterium]
MEAGFRPGCEVGACQELWIQYTRRQGTNPLQTLSLRDAKILNTDGILYTVSGTYGQIWAPA